MSDVVERLEGLAANMRGALVAGAETPAEAAAEIADLRRQLAEAREVKPLEWREEPFNGWKRGLAYVDGDISYNCFRTDHGWLFDGEEFTTLEAAKAAAQADYAARILSALKGAAK